MAARFVGAVRNALSRDCCNAKNLIFLISAFILGVVFHSNMSIQPSPTVQRIEPIANVFAANAHSVWARPAPPAVAEAASALPAAGQAVAAVAAARPAGPPAPRPVVAATPSVQAPLKNVANPNESPTSKSRLPTTRPPAVERHCNKSVVTVNKIGYLADNALWERTSRGRRPVQSTCIGGDQGGTWRDHVFQPRCAAQNYTQITGKDALKCLSGMKVKWIMLLGDSNSRNLYDHIFMGISGHGLPPSVYADLHLSAHEVGPPYYDLPDCEGRHSDRDRYVKLGDTTVLKISLRFIQRTSRLRTMLTGNWTPEQWNALQYWKGAAHPDGSDLGPYDKTPPEFENFTRGMYPDAIVVNYGLWLTVNGLKDFEESYSQFNNNLRHIPTRLAMTSGGIRWHTLFTDANVLEQDEFVLAAGERFGFPVINFREMISPVPIEERMVDGMHFASFVYQMLAKAIMGQLCKWETVVKCRDEVKSQ